MLSYSTYIVTLSVIVGFYYYKKFKNTIYKYFIFYLLYALITDITGFILNKIEIKNENILYNSDLIYNIYFIITFFFYFFFYKKILKKSKNIKRVYLFLILYSLFTIFDFIFLKSSFTNGFITNNIVFGAILVVITLISFLIEIINDEKIIFNIKKSIIFWISVGVLLFHIGVIPIIISSKILEYDGIYDSILLGLNIIMYGSFIIGFICSDTKYNY